MSSDLSDVRQEGSAVFMVGRTTRERPVPDVLDDEYVRRAYLGG